MNVPIGSSYCLRWANGNAEPQEQRTKLARELGGTGLIAVNAHGVRFNRNVGTIQCGHLPLTYHPLNLREGQVQVMDHGVRLIPRGKRAVRLVGAVGEHFVRNFQSGGTAGAYEFAAGEAEQHRAPGRSRARHGR